MLAALQILNISLLADEAPLAPPSGIHAEWWHWGAFALFVAVMLTLDLGVFHRHSRKPTLRESAFWTLFWSGLALAFNALVWHWGGSTAAIQFLTGYLVEWSLSMDNVFVFAVIFTFFKIPAKYQYRVLFWGILGAIAMRLIFILVGAALIARLRMGAVALRRAAGCHGPSIGAEAGRGASGKQYSDARRPANFFGRHRRPRQKVFRPRKWPVYA